MPYGEQMNNEASTVLIRTGKQYIYIYIYNNFIVKITRQKGVTREELNPHNRTTPKI